MTKLTRNTAKTPVSKCSGNDGLRSPESADLNTGLIRLASGVSQKGKQQQQQHRKLKTHTKTHTK